MAPHLVVSTGYQYLVLEELTFPGVEAKTQIYLVEIDTRCSNVKSGDPLVRSDWQIRTVRGFVRGLAVR